MSKKKKPEQQAEPVAKSPRQYRAKMAFGNWPKGFIFNGMPAGQAELLKQRGLIEDCKAMESPVNRMMGAPVTK